MLGLGLTCLFAWRLLRLFGERAASLAMVSAFVGGVLGFILTLQSGVDLDDPGMPEGVLIVITASVGALVFGLIGPARKIEVSRSALKRLALAMAIIGIVTIFLVPSGSIPTAHLDAANNDTRAFAHRYITVAWLQAAVAFNTAVVVMLLLAQAARAKGPQALDQETADRSVPR